MRSHSCRSPASPSSPTTVRSRGSQRWSCNADSASADGRIHYGHQRVRFGDEGQATTSKTSLLLTFRISNGDTSLRSAPPLTIDSPSTGAS